jgi:excisionase family DNA binding protein
MSRFDRVGHPRPPHGRKSDQEDASGLDPSVAGLSESTAERRGLPLAVSTVRSDDCMDRLLTVDQAGELLNTGSRFFRRLIAERRIEFVHVGRCTST